MPIKNPSFEITGSMLTGAAEIPGNETILEYRIRRKKS